MEKVLSIIIPTYNMEKYLNKCLDSLLVSNMNLIEVLVIIDGAKDKSSEIAHQYEDKYPDVFKVIDKENGNYGSCINRGLKEAKGRYVKVLDADDSFDAKNFEKYLDEIKDIDVDLILTDFFTVDDSGRKINRYDFNLQPWVVCDFYNLFKAGKINYHITMHAVTYKLQNLIEMQYVQTEGISYTDMEWCFTPMTKVKKGIYLNIALYNYLVGRPGQTMDISVQKKQITQLIKMTLSLADRYNKEYDKDYHAYLNCIALVQIRNVYKLILVDKYAEWDILDEYDELIKSKSIELYNELEDIKICRIKYIKLWRRYHNKFIQRIVNAIFYLNSKIRG